MTGRVQVGGLQVDGGLKDFVDNEVLPGTGVAAGSFWSGLDGIVRDLAPVNRELLATRDRLQAEIDSWHQKQRGRARDLAAYKDFLRSIGYLLPEGQDF